MSVLILVEHDHHQLNPSIRSVLRAALLLDEKPTLLVVGEACRAIAEQASVLEGVGLVLLADSPDYAYPFPERIAPLMASLAASYTTIMAASSAYGKNTLPRLAALLDVAQISDVTAIVDADTVQHPIYAGNAFETVRLLDAKKIWTIRATAFEAVTSVQTPCPIQVISGMTKPINTRFVRHQLSVSERPDLHHANIVVSGGRGLQSAEQFKWVERLADTLGAAVGASRAAVDAGFVSNDCQIGQTGKVVAPNLYVAIGISGAIQHVAGMKDSKIIVAINKDRDAPIFQIATYGLVGDLFELVPALIEQLNGSVSL